jgi:hypothetical protein
MAVVVALVALPACSSGRPAPAPTIVDLGAPAAALRAVDAAAPWAFARVRSVWDGPWARSARIEVPASSVAFRAAAGARSLDEAAVAIVAPGAFGGSGGSSGSGSSGADGASASGGSGASTDRVVVDPTVFARLSAAGARIVLAHEFTHLASAAATGPGTPTWLIEGLAETVGHDGAGLSVPAAAAELAAQLRAGAPPSRLPTDAEFAAASGAALAALYQQAWLAGRLIADRVGLAGLVRFYRLVGETGGPPARRVDAALRATLGLGTAAFTATWRDYLWAQLQPSPARSKPSRRRSLGSPPGSSPSAKATGRRDPRPAAG